MNMKAPTTKFSSLQKRRKATMTAAVVRQPGEIEMKRIPRPEPGDGEILVRLEGCGMCASTLPKWEGRDWFDYPLEPGDPGHEGFGIVEAIGSGVEEIKPGDRAIFLSYHALAEYDTAKAEETFILPDSLRYKPFPGEALGCVMNVFQRADIRPGQTIAIVGAGFMGCLLTQLAANAGARVIALSRRPFSLEMAKAMGAAETASTEDYYQAIDRVREFTDNQFCDRVIEATGKQQPLNLAGEIVGVRGKLIVAGYHQDGLRKVNMQTWNWKGIDVINAHERNPRQYVRGMKEAVDAFLNYRMDFTPLLTHHFLPDRIDDAFDMLQQRPEGFVKGIINF